MQQQSQDVPVTSGRVGTSEIGAADRVTALLHRAVAWGTVIGTEEFRRYGFNVQGARVLSCLLEGGPTRVGELGTAVAIDNSTLSHLLRRLGQKKLVVRTRLVSDNRSVCVALTGRGRKIAEQCKTASLRHEAQFLQGFTASEIPIVRDFLRRICQNVEKIAKNSLLQQKKRTNSQRISRHHLETALGRHFREQTGPITLPD